MIFTIYDDKNTIRNEDSTALYTVYTVYTVDTVDMVYTADMMQMRNPFIHICLVPMFQWERLAEG